MQALHQNQKKVLEHLLDKHDGASLEEISLYLEITKTAAKEHILRLIDLGYLTFMDTRGSVGRPKRNYLLTETGHEVFPRQYSWLSSVLLELLADDLGPSAVSKLMRSLGKKVASSMRERFEGKENAKLLNEVKNAMNELGYRSYLKQSDLRKGAILEATNCVYHGVAKLHPELCQFDVQFLESTTGMKVKLDSCIARGGSICRFCIKR